MKKTVSSKILIIAVVIFIAIIAVTFLFFNLVVKKYQNISKEVNNKSSSLGISFDNSENQNNNTSSTNQNNILFEDTISLDENNSVQIKFVETEQTNLVINSVFNFNGSNSQTELDYIVDYICLMEQNKVKNYSIIIKNNNDALAMLLSVDGEVTFNTLPEKYNEISTKDLSKKSSDKFDFLTPKIQKIFNNTK